MRKLLAILTVTNITASGFFYSTQAITNPNSKTNSDNNPSGKIYHKKLDPFDEANISKLAGSLIIRHNDDYSFNSLLNVASSTKPTFLSTANKVFGQDNVRNGKFVSDSSAIKYQGNDSKTITQENSVLPTLNISGTSISADELLSLIKTLVDSKGDANAWINTIFEGNLISIASSLGKALDSILDQQSTLSSIISYLISHPTIIDSILSVFTSKWNSTFNATFKDKTYASFDANGKLNSDSAFGIVSSKLEETLTNIGNNVDLQENDFNNIANYLIIFLSYVSQFNYNSSTSIGKNLFDSSVTNKEYLENINKTKISSINSILDLFNFNNLANLLDNLTNYNTNNGLAFAQLIYVMFGDSNNLNASSDQNSTALLDLKVVPTYGCQNPIVASFGSFADLVLSQVIKSTLKIDDNNIFNLVSGFSIGEQLLQMIGSLLTNIVENNWMNNSMDYLEEFTSLLSLIPNSNNFMVHSNPVFKYLKATSINDIVKKLQELIKTVHKDANIYDLDDTFSPTDFSLGNADVKYFVEGNQQSSHNDWFNEIWSGQFNDPVLKELIEMIQSFTNVFNKSYQSNVAEIHGLKYYVSEAMNLQITSGLTVQNLISDVSNAIRFVDKYKSTIDGVISSVGDAVSSLYKSLASDMNNASSVYHSVVTLDGQKNKEIASLVNEIGGKPNANANDLTYISAISLAASKGYINDKYKNNINEVLANILRGTSADASESDVAEGSFVDNLNLIIYKQLKDIIDSPVFTTLKQELDKLEDQPFEIALNGLDYAPISETLDNSKPYKYVFELQYDDPLTAKISQYQVTLDEQNSGVQSINDIFYKMTIINK